VTVAFNFMSERTVVQTGFSLQILIPKYSFLIYVTGLVDDWTDGKIGGETYTDG
jgi:hypothetical protein